MKIFVDADACPVKEIIVETAKKYEIQVLMFFDTSHIYYDGYSHVYTVDKAADSVDFAIINKIEEGDVCVTQDYGLAAMVLSKSSYAVHQNGFLYTKDNIDKMLFERHISKQMRMAGKRGAKHKSRTKENDEKFRIFFESFIKSLVERIK